MSIFKSFILGATTALAATAPSVVFAQSGHASAHTPYAGQQLREIKALSAQEQQDWLEGKGLGLAKAAELNGYPGPMHVLENASALSLTPAQQDASARLMAGHKAQVRALGEQLVAAERRLDEAFHAGTPGDEDVSRLTLKAGALQARIRASHLQTHLAQTALLQPEQVALYQRLRGYAK